MWFPFLKVFVVVFCINRKNNNLNINFARYFVVNKIQMGHNFVEM